MLYTNKKHDRDYQVILFAKCADNGSEEDIVAIYTEYKNIFTTIRIKLVQWLLPNTVYTRKTVEFHEKFCKKL